MRALLATMGLLALASSVHAAETIAHGRFQQVTIYRPPGEVRQVVLFLSDGNGWSAEAASLAQTLAGEGALVAGVDFHQLQANLESDPASCVYPDGDLENLSHFIQAYRGLPSYRAPVLVGMSAGATFAYAILAQSAPGTFGGALSMDFCPRLMLNKPLCESARLHYTKSTDGAGFDLAPATGLQAPWLVLRASDDPACSLDATRAFVSQVPGGELLLRPGTGGGFTTQLGIAQVRAAYEKISRAQSPALPAVPRDLNDLPLVEVAPHGKVDAMAVFISGDGGWAGLDESVAAAIAAHGIPVVGLDSLRYFWTPRTPQSAATDVDRTLRYYLAHWNKSRAILIGYSQGANVLPFIVNRLSEATRSRVALVAMMGLGQTANFEFHLSNWLTKDQSGTPILPEVSKLSRMPVVCLYGEDESGSLCPQLSSTSVRIVKVPGGHHFGGDYDQLATLLLGYAPLH